MEKLMALVAVLGFSMSYGQSDCYSVFFDGGDTPDVLISTHYMEESGTYFAIGQRRETSPGFEGVVAMVIDEDGSLLSEKVYYDSSGSIYGGWMKSLIRLRNGNFLLATSFQTSVTEIRATALEFDASGELLHRWEYTHTNDVIYGCIELDDRSRVFVGQIGVPGGGGDLDIYLIKTDSAGNQLWEKSIGTSSLDMSITVTELAGGDLMLAGWTRNGSFFYEDCYLVKTDSAGNVRWTKQWGMVNQPDYINLTPTASGDVLLYGTRIQGLDGHQAYLAKVDTAGGFLWERFYPDSTGEYYEYSFARELVNGDFLLAGFSTIHGVQIGLVAKHSGAGDLLWSRTYTTDTTIPNYFFGFDLVYDGGMLVSGAGLRGDSIKDHDMWLLRLDSLGLMLDCRDTVPDTTEPPVEYCIYKNGILSQNYPNPFEEKTTLCFGVSELGGDGEIVVMNVLGQEVHRMKVILQQGQVVLDLHDLTPGIYLAQLRAGGEAHGTVKMMKL